MQRYLTGFFSEQTDYSTRRGTARHSAAHFDTKRGRHPGHPSASFWVAAGALLVAGCTVDAPTRDGGGTGGSSPVDAAGGTGENAPFLEYPTAAAWDLSLEGHSDSSEQGGAGGDSGSTCVAPPPDPESYHGSGTTACDGTGTWREGSASEGRREFVIELDGGGRATSSRATEFTIDLEDGDRVQFHIEKVLWMADPFHGHTEWQWNIERASDGQPMLLGGNGASLSGPDLEAAAQMLGVPVSISDAYTYSTQTVCTGMVTEMRKNLTLEADPPIVIAPGTTQMVMLPSGTFSLSWEGHEVVTSEPYTCADYMPSYETRIFEVARLP